MKKVIKKQNFSLTGKQEYDMVNKVSERKCAGSCRRQQVPIRCKGFNAFGNGLMKQKDGPQGLLSVVWNNSSSLFFAERIFYAFTPFGTDFFRKIYKEVKKWQRLN